MKRFLITILLIFGASQVWGTAGQPEGAKAPEVGVKPNPITPIDLTPDTLSPMEIERRRLKIIQIASEMRNPFIAGMFSLFYSGTGQFYNGNYTRGSLLFLGETVFYVFNYGMRLKFYNTYGESANFFALNPADQYLLAGSFVFYIALKVYSIYDAYHSAAINNARLMQTLEKIKLSYNPDEISVSYCLRF